MDIRRFLKHCKALSTEKYRHFTLPFDWEASAVIHNWFIVSLLLFFGHARVVSREVLYHILSHWCDRKEIIVAINKFIEYVANSWYCKLFDCLSGFVESKIP